jgi:nucleotide-binding universal stress UspA family protein
MLKTIVVPLDGSVFAQRALPYAQVLARRTRARVILLRAIEAGFSPRARELAHGEMQDALQELALVSNNLKQRGIPTVAARPYDEPSWAIITAAQEERADLIVMSTHGRSGMGRWVYGSVAERVLRVAPAPMLMVPAAATFNWPSEPEDMRIVVPLDGSEAAQAILGIATDIAEATGGTIVLVQAFLPPPWAVGIDPSDLEYDPVELAEGIRARLASTVAGLTARGIRSELYLHEGQPHEVILDAVEAHRAHLVAMSTHGRTGLARLMMGSVADAVLRESRVALLLARPQASLLTSDEELVPASVGELEPSREGETAPQEAPVAVLMTPAEAAVTAQALRYLVRDHTGNEEMVDVAQGLLARLNPSMHLLPTG